MISLLRKIRRSLIESGSAQKYFFYAIGEITLVVLGILIALQINNWNEHRKDRIAENQALVNLKVEFQKNHNDLIEHIKWKTSIQNQWKLFLDTLTDNNLPGELRYIKRPMASFVFYNISNSFLNSLLNTGNIDNLRNDSLKTLLITWEDEIIDYNQFQEMHSNFAKNEFFPYERSLFMNENNERYGYYYEFNESEDQVKLFEKAYNQREYQNILLQNFYWINIQLSRIKRLSEKMDTIIALLENEIDD